MESSAIFLIVVAAVVCIFVLAISVVSLIKFQHPDDKNQAYLPKFIVILGFFVIFAVSLIMPFDVANRNNDVNMNIDTLWMIALIVVAVFVLIIVPFAFFYYENEGVEETVPDDVRPGLCDTQCGAAIGYTLLTLIVIIALSVVLYITPANTAYVPVHYMKQTFDQVHSICSGNIPTPWTPLQCTVSTIDKGCSITGETYTWKLHVTWLVYLFALMSFIGWFFFMIFSGVGLIALPLDLINAYRTRPIPLPQSRYLYLAGQLATRADSLLEEVNAAREGSTNQNVDLNKRKRRRLNSHITDLETKYHELSRDWDILKICKDFTNSNPLWYVFQMVMGIIGLLLSVAWILHICLFVLPGRGNAVTPFLNTLFIELESLSDGDFPLFGILAYAIFVFYLMWCVIKGNYKFGIRFLLFRVYPMEVGNTMMNAFLANLWILLVCTFPLVHFTATAFPVYSRYTAVQNLFGQQVRYLNFFKYFWEYNIFIYAMLFFALMTLVVSIICPLDSTKQMTQLMDERAARKNGRIK